MRYSTFWHDMEDSDYPIPEQRCDKCVHYDMIDSAFGYCRKNPPQVYIVGIRFRLSLLFLEFVYESEYPTITWHTPKCSNYAIKPPSN